MQNQNVSEQKDCPVCPRADREWIETLMAAGAYYDDLRLEFGIRVIDLRRHEALHSTKQPSVDPLTILREIRWLNEQSTKIVRRELAGKSTVDLRVFNRRQAAISSALRVLHEYSNLVDAPKKLDQQVVLPRWHQVIMKLSERLKDIPGAHEALIEWAKEEGPANSGIMVKTNKIRKQIEQEKAAPAISRYHHRQHTCPSCGRKMRCFNPDCTNPVQTCRYCIAAKIEEKGERMPDVHEHECPKCRTAYNCEDIPCNKTPELCKSCRDEESLKAQLDKIHENMDAEAKTGSDKI